MPQSGQPSMRGPDELRRHPQTAAWTLNVVSGPQVRIVLRRVRKHGPRLAKAGDIAIEGGWAAERTGKPPEALFNRHDGRRQAVERQRDVVSSRLRRLALRKFVPAVRSGDRAEDDGREMPRHKPHDERFSRHLSNGRRALSSHRVRSTSTVQRKSVKGDQPPFTLDEIRARLTGGGESA